MKPTLATIAAEIGLSKSTVSLALRESPLITPATRVAVREAADRLGYRSNPMVSALMTSVRGKNPQLSVPTLAFLTCFPEREGWRIYPSFVQHFEGMKKRAEELGYRVELHWYEEDKTGEQTLTQILESRGIQGVIISPLRPEEVQINLDWSQFATVAIGHSFTAFDAHRVVNHHFHGITLAMEQILARGYRRPGLVMPMVNLWLAGYHTFQVTHPRLAPIKTLLEKVISEEGLTRWLSQEQPDVLISSKALHRSWIEAEGRRVPKDIGYVHLDCGAAELSDFAGVDQKSEEIGAAAVDLLVEEIHSNSRGIPDTPKTVLINGQWQEGTTLPPRRFQ
jgi:DNA-binding LacI/PurR family transcriptional regulator